MYRYTGRTTYTVPRRRNLHWPSLNVTVLLNDRLRGAERVPLTPQIPLRG